MFNFLFTLLILPFAPFWSYGQLYHNQGGNWRNDCVGNICNIRSDKNLNSYSLFPISEAVAAGLAPEKITDNPELKVWAGSSVAIDVDSGTILHYDDGRKHVQIASLTKMMTASLAIENIKDLNAPVTITRTALDVDGTKVGCPTSVICNSNRMFVGEKVRAIDLLHAMLMNSDNDAATALGIYMAGTPDKFVKMMNAKAKSLGLIDTHFCTPSGLEIDGHEDECYSSAYDIARIAAYSMRYKLIWQIMETPSGQFYSTDGGVMHELQNTDLLLTTLPGCIGGKTGFTPLAGKSLLLGAEDPTSQHRIIAVILDDNNRWTDMRDLVDWIFANYKWQ